MEPPIWQYDFPHQNVPSQFYPISAGYGFVRAFTKVSKERFASPPGRWSQVASGKPWKITMFDSGQSATKRL